jgi:hypothetical protein
VREGLVVEVGKVGWLVGRGVEEEEKEEVGEPLEGRDEEEERSRLFEPELRSCLSSLGSWRA